MRITKTDTSVEISENIENDSTITLPYTVTRTEYITEIVWFGLNKNWKYIKSEKKWYGLISCNFIECDVPKYEKIYQKFLRASKIDNLLEPDN